ncbi:MAG: sulfotransferase [Hyphomicrobiales bacterium]|nr:sulfotransferase [Hyphomicrobiales bacterium]
MPSSSGSSQREAASPGSGPDFLCIGAQKGGTQWLYDQLAPDPQFWMPPIKELHHFDLPGSRLKKARRLYRLAKEDFTAFNAKRQRKHRRLFDSRDLAFLEAFIELGASIDFERYASLFDLKGSLIAGDITPGYSGLGAKPISAIARRFPGLKVIFMARNPVDRFWSAFNMRIRRRDISPAIDPAAIRAFAARRGVIRRSSTAATVKSWRSAMPPKQFGLFFFDDLVADPAALRARVLTFLDASPSALAAADESFNRKASRNKIAMDSETRALVGSIFADELVACAEQLGGPAVGWSRTAQR